MVFFVILAVVIGSFGMFASRVNAVDSCGYPVGSAPAKTAVTFNESTVLKGFALDDVHGTIQAFYSDEHALTLGQNTVSNSVTYAITPFTAKYPSNTASITTGTKVADVETVAVNVGFPGSATTLTQYHDWQQPGTTNSQGLKPDALFGTWKSFTPNVTIPDPAKNNWILGPGSDPLPGALQNEGYGAEIRWNATSVPGGLIANHVYRFQFMVHDGDQNKTGGDVGEACVNFTVPDAGIFTTPGSGGFTSPTASIKIPAANSALASSMATAFDVVTLKGNKATLAPTGTMQFNLYGPGDPTCGGTAVSPSPNNKTLNLVGGHPNWTAATSDAFGPLATGIYSWEDLYIPDGASVYPSAEEPCGHETVQAVAARILLTPSSATNAVGTSHTLTATVQSTVNDTVNGTAYSPVTSSVTVSFAVTSGSATPPSGSCVTDGTGKCTFAITSAVTGTNTIHATSQFTLTGVQGTFSIATGSGASSSDATKLFERARILLSPTTATNAVNTSHTLTATVQTNDGSGWASAPNGTTVNFTATAPATPTSGTCSLSSGTCTFAITSTTSGTVTINVSSTFSVGGIGGTFTVATDTGGDNGTHATKIFEEARLRLSPGTDTDAIGTPHTITATVDVTADGGSTWTNATSVTVSYSVTSGSATPASGSCVTDGTGKCTFAITSAVAGPNTIHGTTSFTLSGVGGTFTAVTGTGFSSSDAVKTYERARILLSPPSDTDAINEAHTVTATVQTDTTGLPGNWAAAPVGTTVTFAVTGSATPATGSCTTLADGTCTFAINSVVIGLNTIHASSTFTVAGVDGTFTVATSTGAPNGADVTKTYEDARVVLSPLSADNPALQAHTVTATVQVTADGTTWASAPDGTTVSFSLIPGSPNPGANFVPTTANTCTTTGGTCTIVINGTTAGTVTIHATTQFTVTGVGGTFSATTGVGSNSSSDATKTWHQLPTTPKTDLYVKDQITNLPADATGTVTYKAYTDATCTTLATTFGSGGDITDPANNTISGATGPKSLEVHITPGTSLWFQATYSGDAKYLGSTTACNEAASSGN